MEQYQIKGDEVLIIMKDGKRHEINGVCKIISGVVDGKEESHCMDSKGNFVRMYRTAYRKTSKKEVIEFFDDKGNRVQNAYGMAKIITYFDDNGNEVRKECRDINNMLTENRFGVAITVDGKFFFDKNRRLLK